MSHLNTQTAVMSARGINLGIYRTLSKAIIEYRLILSPLMVLPNSLVMTDYVSRGQNERA